MKVKFKRQQFQEDATNAVCDVFKGQPNKTKRFLADKGEDTSGAVAMDFNNSQAWGNEPLHLREEDLLANIKTIQKDHLNGKTDKSRSLQTIISKVDWEDGRKETLTRPVFTVEMETGTGKTYTYIKTMYELNARYGWSKFIIVVPSVAIREGVAKTFSMTADHFKQEYGKACRSFVYNSSRLNELEQFADDPGINVMIINTQAFNARGKDARRIYMKLDSFRSRRPIDVIGSVNPIMIIDEPQSVIGTEDSKNVARNSLGKFRPLFFINYSATHRENFNMVYRLDAVDAYQKQLVKKINVKGITVKGSTATSGYLYLQKINVYPNKSPTATVLMEMISKTGSAIKKKLKTLEVGDNIYDHSGEIEAYREGFVVSDIRANDGYVEFTNGTKIEQGNVVGESNEEDIRRIQIRETIMSHLEKERELFKKGVKVLSLFFIDEVSKYKLYDDSGEQKGEYAQIFEAEYSNAVDEFFEQLPYGEDTEYRKFLKRNEASELHAGYFSKDKKGRIKDSKVKRGENGSSDVGAYDLIMRNKERLLSRDEPIRFIFSHSALREGWDNPNVFQICTLRMSSGEIKKRQEIGRGLRLSVNANGERMDAEHLGSHAVHDVNALTVIANESYEEFAGALQDEFHQVIKNRPRKVDPDLFEGHVFTNSAGDDVEIDSSKAAEIFVGLKMSGLVKDNQLTDEFNDMPDDSKKSKITQILDNVSEEMSGGEEITLSLLESVYDSKKNPMIHDDRKNKVLHLDREKYASKEFKELWSRINQKSYYTVEFDENKLVDDCIASINKQLRVTKTKIVVTQGYLDASRQDNPEMKKHLGKEIILEQIAAKNVTFDLLDELTSKTEITRKSAAGIMSSIEAPVFEQFAANPEEFIREAIRLINEQKATTVVEHITYDVQDESWNEEEIFVDATIKGEYGKNLADAKKHLYDKVRYDSGVERDIIPELDAAESVQLYVKLPNSFYIHTPMGNYNPDWAIAFKEGSVKHIYFVAETKGDVSETYSLRPVEKAKINCAEKHFKAISGDKVKYSAVSSYEELMRLVS